MNNNPACFALFNTDYLVTNENTVYFADTIKLQSERGDSWNILVIIDFVSRLVTGYLVSTETITAKDIIQVFKASILAQKEGKPVIFHRDRDHPSKISLSTPLGKSNLQLFSQFFLNDTSLKKFADDNQILLSPVTNVPKCNQVTKRFYITLKQLLKAKMFETIITTSDKNYLKRASFARLLATYKEVGNFSNTIHEAIEIYNHKNKLRNEERLLQLGPNHLDETPLFTELKVTKNLAVNNKNLLEHTSFLPGLQMMSSTKSSSVSFQNKRNEKVSRIAEYRTNVVDRFAGSWEEFFLDFEHRTSQSLERITEQNRSLAGQNSALYEQNQMLLQKISFLEESEKKRQEEKRAEDERKLKRKSAKKQRTRDAIEPAEFEQILQLTKDSFKEPLTIARVKLALAILYTTGLRISNLLLLRRKNIQELLLKEECEVDIIKGGGTRQLICIGNPGKKLLQTLSPEIILLEYNQPNEDGPIFTSKFYNEKPISGRALLGQVNKVLAKASQIFNKNLKSHSFRATYVTDLLEQGVPIEKVKDIIGHSNIGTTATYRRSNITLKELRKTTASLNSNRLKGIENLKTYKK